MDSKLRTIPVRLAAVVAMVLSLVVVTAAPALASDVVVRTLDAVCADDDSDGISFAVTTDREGAAAEHPAIRVEWKPAGLDDDAYQELGTGELAEHNGYTYSDTVTGLDFGDATQVTVRATALRAEDGGGTWGDGRAAGDDYTRTIPVDDCGDGDPGENGRMNFTAGCTTAAGEPGVILHNDGTAEDGPLDFQVEAAYEGHHLSETVTVQPGRSRTVLLVFTDENGDQVDTEDGSIEVRTTVGDSIIERTIDVDCEDDAGPPPTAGVRSVCEDDAGVVVADLDNPTDAPVEFVVTIDGTVVDRITVAAGTSDSASWTVGEGSHLATVEAAGVEVADAELLVDCAASPSAVAAVECFEQGVLEVELRNPDAAPATFEVLVDGTIVDTREVAEDVIVGSHTVQDGDRHVEVRADGVSVLERTVSVDCSLVGSIAAAVEVVCAPDDGRLVATVDNPGEDPTTVQVLVDGVVRAGTDVAAGAVTEVAVAGVADGDRRVEVTADGGTIHDRILAVDCVEVRGVTDSQEPAPGGDGEGRAAAPDDVVVAGEQLPATGVGTLAWLLVGLLLLFLGGDLVLSELLSRLQRGR